MRVLLGGIAAALALTAVPAAPASAEEVRCTDGFELLCTAYYVAQNATCHPKFNPC